MVESLIGEDFGLKLSSELRGEDADGGGEGEWLRMDGGDGEWFRRVGGGVGWILCWIFSISMSEQLSEFDSAESIDVTVILTCLSLQSCGSKGFSAANFSTSVGSLSFGWFCTTKLLLLISSIALRSWKGKNYINIVK